MANLTTVKHYAQFLAEMGYVAFCFDFCGGCVMMADENHQLSKIESKEANKKQIQIRVGEKAYPFLLKKLL